MIGLGRFGLALAQRLRRVEGLHLVAVDRSKELVDRVNSEETWATHFQSWDPEHLAELGIDASVDAAVVAIGEEAEDAQHWVVVLLDVGVKRIVARAQTATHAQIMQRLMDTAGEGHDHEVVRPELEAAGRLATRLIHPDVLEVMTLRGSDQSLATFKVPDRFVGLSIADAGIRRHYGLNVLRVRRVPGEGEGTGIREIVPVGPEVELQEGDELTVLGDANQIRGFRGEGG